MSDITLEAHGQNRTDDNGFADRSLNLLGTWACAVYIGYPPTFKARTASNAHIIYFAGQ